MLISELGRFSFSTQFAFLFGLIEHTTRQIQISMVRNVVTAADSVDVKFEIGHVLFVDIVGYSKLLIHEQSEQLEKLREIARATEQFRAAQAEGKLLRLPTGDGGALVFSDSPETPVG